jgi:hypothetical protein
LPGKFREKISADEALVFFCVFLVLIKLYFL